MHFVAQIDLKWYHSSQEDFLHQDHIRFKAENIQCQKVSLSLISWSCAFICYLLFSCTQYLEIDATSSMFSRTICTCGWFDWKISLNGFTRKGWMAQTQTVSNPSGEHHRNHPFWSTYFSTTSKGTKRGIDKDESGANDIFRQRQQKRANR